MIPKTIRTTVFREGRKFRFVEEEYEIAPGKRFVIEKVEHPGAVVILPIDTDGRIVLLRQYRQSLRDFLLELPAGTLEKGEDPILCAMRELAEEIGCMANDWHDLGTLFPAPGFTDELQYCYLARGLSPEAADKDDDEVLEPVRMTVTEVDTAIRNNSLVDAKSIAVLTKARLSGLI